jgi:phosphoribosyl 1,2-cyclic phosphate phosphodiesterase
MLKLTFLGTGTSQGIPLLGCNCEVCKSNNLKDKRLRTSLNVQSDELCFNIDCGPDFRQQMLANNITNLDAILLTHQHFDHIGGLDDTRPIIHHNNRQMDLYGNSQTLKGIKNIFSYAFEEDLYPGAPSFKANEVNEEAFFIKNLEITPIKIIHGYSEILGYKFADVAYLTDVKSIPESEFGKLKNLKILIINALRQKSPHFSHIILPEALEIIEKLKPEKAYITHIAHEMGLHNDIILPQNVELAYDGLVLEL